MTRNHNEEDIANSNNHEAAEHTIEAHIHYASCTTLAAMSMLMLKGRAQVIRKKTTSIDGAIRARAAVIISTMWAECIIEHVSRFFVGKNWHTLRTDLAK